MVRILVGYLAVAVVMAVLDIVWLTTVMRGLFESAAGGLLAEKTNYPAAILFYVLYIGGILLFAVMPGLRGGGWTTTLAMGAAFGFFCYMTYDLTNMATLKVWPVWLAALDISWGTLVTAVAAAAGYLAASRVA